jgi:hypothetical protein
VPIARGIARVDAIRARTPAASHDPGDLDASPRALLAVVAHWRPDTAPDASAGERGEYLRRCLDGLLAPGLEQVVAVVLTNAPEGVARTLRDDLAGRDTPVPVRVAEGAVDGAPDVAREVVVVRGRQRWWQRSDFYLPWGHVPILREAAATGRFSHLVYLEDDIGFTERHLRYWCRYRRPLAAHGLLPGFARFEYSAGERYLVDVVYPVEPGVRRLRIDGDHEAVCDEVVNLENPYQALYVLDAALAAEYLSRPRTAFRSRAMPIALGVRERAATGPHLDDVPPGLMSRNVVPVRTRDGVQRLDPECLVEHLAGTYTNTPDSHFGTLRVDDLFVPQT